MQYVLIIIFPLTTHQRSSPLPLLSIQTSTPLLEKKRYLKNNSKIKQYKTKPSKLE